MTSEEFVRKYGKFRVNGPAYRGASYPPFEEDKINESEFSDKLRYKNVTIDNYDDVVDIDWESQEWDDDYKDFVNEIKRFYNYLAKKYELKEIVVIGIHLYDRDGIGSMNISFNIGED